MPKESLYLVHADVDSAVVAAWSAFHATEHVPLVVKHASFLAATRWRHADASAVALEPPRFTTAYRAAALGVVRSYLEGGEVGKMRAHHEAWLAANVPGRKAALSREVLEENHSVDSDGKPLVRTPEMNPGRGAFVVRVRVEPSDAGAWSNWYDADHMPDVVRTGGFLRAGRWRVADEAAGATRFLVIYEAPSPEVVAAFRAGPGPRFGKEHEARFGGKVTVEREVWIAC